MTLYLLGSGGHGQCCLILAYFSTEVVSLVLPIVVECDSLLISRECALTLDIRAVTLGRAVDVVFWMSDNHGCHFVTLAVWAMRLHQTCTLVGQGAYCRRIIAPSGVLSFIG